MRHLQKNMGGQKKEAGTEAFSPRQQPSEEDFCRTTTTQTDSIGTITQNFIKRSIAASREDDGERKQEGA